MIKFDEKELEIVSTSVGPFGGPAVPLYNFPVKLRDAYKGVYKKNPIWQITGIERNTFNPRLIPDVVARASVMDGRKAEKTGGKDMFGLDWEYIPQVGGSMIRPGKPFLSSIDEWYDKVVWPDIDSWDWEGGAKNVGDYLKTDKYNVSVFYTGWYERLISLLDFENAAVALIDEEQQDAVKDFFEKLSELYIRIFEKYTIYFPEVDLFIIHDDWGSQKETFFSPNVAKEMIVPYMRKVTDYLHSKGKFCELHSCGMNMKQVPNFIEADWDSWNPQAMNDTQKIYELYGDKIIIAVIPDSFDPSKCSEEEQIAAAKTYAEKFCNPNKPSMLNMYASNLMSPTFRKELYKQSRINYSK